MREIYGAGARWLANKLISAGIVLLHAVDDERPPLTAEPALDPDEGRDDEGRDDAEAAFYETARRHNPVTADALAILFAGELVPTPPSPSPDRPLRGSLADRAGAR